MAGDANCRSDTFITHRIQFYDFQPSPFTCLSRSDVGLIAAGRENGSLDVYDEKNNFFMVCHIPSSALGSVESIAWRNDRLFCVGATGVLSEIEVCSSMVKDSCVVSGSSIIRSLSVIEDTAIVGNDEGFVTFYTLSPKMLYVFALPKFDGKILSTACSQKKRCLAVSTSKGSLSTYVKNETYQHEYCLISDSDKSIIWTLTFACGFLISGNSEGSVSVWDVKLGGLLYSFPSHLGDVLTLTTSPDEKTVYSGGSDALVRKYELFTSENGEIHWELSGILRGCRRDIRGLACLPPDYPDPSNVDEDDGNYVAPRHRLLACGLDARLQIMACEQALGARRLLAHRANPTQVGDGSAVAAALPYWPASICCPPPLTGCDLSLNSRLALLHYPTHLSLVRLGQPADSQRQVRGGHQLVPMLQAPLRLAEVQPRRGAQLIASALSACGHFIAYSDCQRTRVLRFSSLPDKKNVLLPRVSITRLTWPSPADTRRGARKRSHSASGASGGNLSPALAATPASSSETTTDTEDVSPEDAVSPTRLASFFSVSVGSGQWAKKSTINPFAVTGKCAPASGDSPPLDVPSRCLAFTPDSQHVILVPLMGRDQSSSDGGGGAWTDDYSLVCVSLKSGTRLWRVRIAPGAGSTQPVHVHSLSVSPTTMKDLGGYIIALGCLDGRVRLHSSSSGAHLFTCPCLDSPTGHPPLPVCIAFRRDQRSSSGQTPAGELHLAILYTNSQLTAWKLTPAAVSTEKCQGDDDREQPTPTTLSAELNSWLLSFWRQMGSEIQSTLGVFHSLVWLSGHTWMLASDSCVVLLTARKPYWSGMLKKIVLGKHDKEAPCCLRVSKNFESILQATAISPRELVVITVNSAAITLRLTAPMQRKAFGT